MTRSGRIVAAIAGILLATNAYVPSARSQDVEGFYQNRQGRFIIHTTPGGTYDAWARLLSPFLTKYLPGHPVFIPQNMPGAGGLVAANYLYSVAPRDGSVIGMVGRNIPSDALMGEGSVTFDPRRFNWLGNPEAGATVAVVTDKSPAKNAKELFQTEVLVGGAGAGSAVSLMPIVIRNLLGMKFRLVEGYGSQSAVTLAMERGEVHGTFATMTAVQTSMGGGLETGRLRVLFNLEQKPEPGLNAPSVFEFAKSDEERQVLRLLSVSSDVGRPVLAPPDVPTARVEALRLAFDQAMRDPELLSQAATMKLPVSRVVTGQELAAIIDELMKTPKPVIDRMRIVSRD